MYRHLPRLHISGNLDVDINKSIDHLIISSPLMLGAEFVRRSSCTMPRTHDAEFIYLLLFLSCRPLAASEVCNRGIYGVPSHVDCVQAFTKIPYTQAPESQHESSSRELFSEPQYLVPPFGGVINRYRPKPINQLPKIWRYSKY